MAVVSGLASASCMWDARGSGKLSVGLCAHPGWQTAGGSGGVQGRAGGVGATARRLTSTADSTKSPTGTDSASWACREG